MMSPFKKRKLPNSFSFVQCRHGEDAVNNGNIKYRYIKRFGQNKITSYSPCRGTPWSRWLYLAIKSAASFLTMIYITFYVNHTMLTRFLILSILFCWPFECFVPAAPLLKNALTVVEISSSKPKTKGTNRTIERIIPIQIITLLIQQLAFKAVCYVDL